MGENGKVSSAVFAQEKRKRREKQVVSIRSSLEGDRGKYGVDRLTWDSAVRHEMRLGNKQRRFRMSNGNGVYS